MNKFQYLLQLADNALILGHRLSEWCGHGPILEQDIAITNIALDLVGQARSWYQYAGEVEGKGRSEDDLAYLRDSMEFRNTLLVEQPNEDWAYTIVRQFFFDSYNYYLHLQLAESNDEQIKAIAIKSLKEITYHLRYSSEWMIRLGDGTEVSHNKMQTAVDDLWMYTGELCTATEVDKAAHAEGFGADMDAIKLSVNAKIKDIMQQATLAIPENGWMQKGGKVGRHSEHLGFILADLQFLQRAYPGNEW